MELYATDAEVIGWLVILAVLFIGLLIFWLRHGREDASVSKGWTHRHIDDRNNYRP